jgi:hypothetical protein
MSGRERAPSGVWRGTTGPAGRRVGGSPRPAPQAGGAPPGRQGPARVRRAREDPRARRAGPVEGGAALPAAYLPPGLSAHFYITSRTPVIQGQPRTPLTCRAAGRRTRTPAVLEKYPGSGLRIQASPGSGRARSDAPRRRVSCAPRRSPRNRPEPPPGRWPQRHHPAKRRPVTALAEIMRRRIASELPAPPAARVGRRPPRQTEPSRGSPSRFPRASAVHCMRALRYARMRAGSTSRGPGPS